MELALNTEGGVARYISGSGTETLVMQYTVKEGHVASKLDYRDSQALVSQNTEGGRSPVVGHVRRKSLFPMTDEILTLRTSQAWPMIIISRSMERVLDCPVCLLSKAKKEIFLREETH